jgi:hypothetical protein
MNLNEQLVKLQPLMATISAIGVVYLVYKAMAK